jgi:hypothetical protein
VSVLKSVVIPSPSLGKHWNRDFSQATSTSLLSILIHYSGHVATEMVNCQFFHQSGPEFVSGPDHVGLIVGASSCGPLEAPS